MKNVKPDLIQKHLKEVIHISILSHVSRPSPGWVDSIVFWHQFLKPIITSFFTGLLNVGIDTMNTATLWVENPYYQMSSNIKTANVI